jgi:hypothetical protein
MPGQIPLYPLLNAEAAVRSNHLKNDGVLGESLSVPWRPAVWRALDHPSCLAV